MNHFPYRLYGFTPFLFSPPFQVFYTINNVRIPKFGPIMAGQSVLYTIPKKRVKPHFCWEEMG